MGCKLLKVRFVRAHPPSMVATCLPGMSQIQTWALKAPPCWLLVLMGMALGPWALAHGAVGEEAALLTIRSGFTNGETVLADWTNETGSPCRWTYVGCSGGNVTAL